MKNIRDSVHGNIKVEDNLIEYIIDTPTFQRLRRIEQTAIRSIYPSARHDRFIHSLGVFHIGSLFVDHLQEELQKSDELSQQEKNSIPCIVKSYIVACLLHDIAHAPFSHTFESYYGIQSDLFDKLNSLLSGRLSKELKKVDGPNYHEYASAIVSCVIFGEAITNNLGGDVELVCRMIIGCFYKSEKKSHQLHNCFISLLHGDVVDADRMDYACRDVWASGYCTSSIDLTRIVKATHIRREKRTGELNVCFDSKALNEITNMLDVRQFQNKYVINHHSVQYEQTLMVRAAEEMAQHLYHQQNLPGDKALQKIITVDNCMQEAILPNGYVVNYLSDEDLLVLMKQDKNNRYYLEYATRKYTRFALWKSPDEFFHYFDWIPRIQDLKSTRFEEKVKCVLSEFCDPNEVILVKVKYKPQVNLRSLYVVVNNDLTRYTELHPELDIDFSTSDRDMNFYYVYMPSPSKSIFHDLNEYRRSVVNKLRPVMEEIYTVTNKEYVVYDYIMRGIEKAYAIIEPENAEKRKKQIEKMLENYELDKFIRDTKMSELLGTMKVDQ